MSLGKRIREYRIKRGYTQSQMAAKLNMTEANFSSYERDKSIPPSEKLSQIASILNVSTDYLLGHTDIPTPFTDKANSNESSIPDWASSRDIRDFKKMLEDDAPVMFDGMPLDDEDKEKVLKVMEAIFWDAKKKNKRKPVDE
jgi:HTH-type transcriptional regulator, competence development regulator